MRKVLAIAYVFMAFLLPDAPALAKESASNRPAPSKADTIRRITVKVVARERPTNYDSIFRSQPNHFDSQGKSSYGKATAKPKRGNKNPYVATISKNAKPTVTKVPRPRDYDFSETPAKRPSSPTMVREPQKRSASAKKQVNAPEAKSRSENLAVNTSNAPQSNGTNPEPKEEPLFAEAYEDQPKQESDVPPQNPAASNPELQSASVIDSALPEVGNAGPAIQNRANELSIENSPKANKISYMWIGFVLVLAGVVLGLVFGRTAFMVSAVGLVFLIIGFLI